MKAEELQILINDDKAFRLWTIEHISKLEGNWRLLGKAFSVSMLVNVLLAVGAIAGLLHIWK